MYRVDLCARTVGFVETVKSVFAMFIASNLSLQHGTETYRFPSPVSFFGFAARITLHDRDRSFNNLYFQVPKFLQTYFFKLLVLI